MASMGLISVRLDTKRLDEIIRNSSDNAGDIINKLAEHGVEYIRENARFETHAMEQSVYFVSQDQDHYNEASQRAQQLRPEAQTEPHPKPEGKAAANIGPCVHYAIYNEFGTSRMSAQPFVVPGIERLANEFNRGENWKDLLK